MIYPVHLSQWFPARRKDRAEWMTFKEARALHDTTKMIVEGSTCCVCGKKPSWRSAWGLHSIPWGYGCDEIWCSEKCLNAGREKL